MKQYAGNSVNLLTFINADKVVACAEINILSAEKHYHNDGVNELEVNSKTFNNRIFFEAKSARVLAMNLLEIADQLDANQARFENAMKG